MCRATKGSDGNASLCFTNVGAQASWRQTFFDSEPWVLKPAFMDLPAFRLEMLAPDVLHVFHLGIGRDLVASALRVLTKNQDVFVGRTQALRLRCATDRLLDFANHHGHQLSIKRLSSKTLGFKSKKYPEAHCKGFDCYVILRFLVQQVEQNPPPRPSLALWGALGCRQCSFCLDEQWALAYNRAATAQAGGGGSFLQDLHHHGRGSHLQKTISLEGQAEVSPLASYDVGQLRKQV